MRRVASEFSSYGVSTLSELSQCTAIVNVFVLTEKSLILLFMRQEVTENSLNWWRLVVLSCSYKVKVRSRIFDDVVDDEVITFIFGRSSSSGSPVVNFCTNWIVMRRDSNRTSSSLKYMSSSQSNFIQVLWWAISKYIVLFGHFSDKLISIKLGLHLCWTLE